MEEKIIFQGTEQRIDQRLTKTFSYSRNFFHHIISRWWILVNNKPIKKSYKLKDWDVVEIDNLERYLWSEILSEAPDIQIPIILEKEDFLVINKPKGVLSHPNSVRDVKNPNVVWFLYHRYKDLPTVGNFIRAGLIHRLDKDTDGLMLIAKTEQGLSHFKVLFQAKSESKTIEQKEKIKLKKFYQAQCHILDSWKKFLFDIQDKLPYYIIQDVVPKTPHPVIKEWISKILSVQTEWNQATIQLEILTGRTHQIRYHLSQAGLPIVGDYLYWKDKDWPVQLTAKQLVFEDLEKNIVTVTT